jgi:HSP20 family molecular chaperone IbpA
MAFALAGYSSQDIQIEASGRELFVSGSGVRVDPVSPDVQVTDEASEESSDDYPPKNPNFQIQQGMIVRGIARRSFKTKFFMSPAFDTAKARAVMKNGLLELIVPHSEPAQTTNIKITEI